MRPRHYCRGKVSGRIEDSFVEGASMRPRHYCRGKLAGDNSRTAVCLGCFNEAAALLPRKGIDLARAALIQDPASMRPRHYCRGKCRRRNTTLQGSSRFNEAAALLPRKVMCWGSHLF